MTGVERLEVGALVGQSGVGDLGQERLGGGTAGQPWARAGRVLWARQRAGQDLSGLVHHSDRGVQYRAIRYTERLAEAEAIASVGIRGDSYDNNAMAEALNSLFKAECIRNPVMRPQGGWKSIGDVEIAVAEYVDWQGGTPPKMRHPAARFGKRTGCGLWTWVRSCDRWS